MAQLLSTHRLQKSFGSRQLFDGLSFALNSGDRIGLIGPNGAGKSTLLRCLVGMESPDGGEITSGRGVRIGYLAQTPTFDTSETILDALTATGDADDPMHLAQVYEWISRFQLTESGRTAETKVNELSGGWQKRVALARELIQSPDLLLLDEPTNHLDVEGILWLEDFLANSPMALLMVTHDRLFLERTVNRIIDLDSRYKNGFLDFKGSYSNYLETREQLLSAQLKLEDVSRNQLRRETEWLRRGAKARQTKQKARIERAGDLRDSTEELTKRNQDKTARIEFQDTERRPQKLIEAVGISAERGGRTLFNNLDLLITPKTRLALLGVNGCGKSTLIRMLLNRENPDTGQVSHAEQMKYAWFEQDKQSLDPNLPLIRAVCPEGDYVHFQGRAIFARAYLNRFHFRSEQLDMPIARLSGGEKSRLRVAQLMLQPANVLVLDEPTNDLDSATLDVLAASLENFDGAVILVTHDRYFLDQVTNDILAFPVVEGDKELRRFAGYAQWEVWHDDVLGASRGKASSSRDEAGNRSEPVSKKKISFKDKHEWENIEANIAKKESQLEKLQTEASLPAVTSDTQKVTELFAQIGALQAEIERLYIRWSELEKIINA